MIKVSPSILSADFANMERDCKQLEENGADYIHCDVMDGSFVPQITFGTKMVAAVKKISSLPLDVHLMIKEPMKHIESFYKAGSDLLTIHYEADSSEEIINYIKSFGIKAGISIKPNTDVTALEDLLPLVDLVLIMSVEPGKGGQSFLNSALEKIAYIKEYSLKHNKDLIIEVDGGINFETGKLCVDSGANTLVSGSFIFKADDMKTCIEGLKSL